MTDNYFEKVEKIAKKKATQSSSLSEDVFIESIKRYIKNPNDFWRSYYKIYDIDIPETYMCELTPDEWNKVQWKGRMINILCVKEIISYKRICAPANISDNGGYCKAVM